MSRLEGRWGSGGPTTIEEVLEALGELKVRVPREIDWRIVPDEDFIVAARARQLDPSTTEAMYFPNRTPSSSSDPMFWKTDFLRGGRLEVQVRESVMSNPYKAVQRFAHEAAEIRSLRASFARAARSGRTLRAGDVDSLIDAGNLRNLHSHANDYADLVAGDLQGMGPAELFQTQSQDLAGAWIGRIIRNHYRRMSMGGSEPGGRW